MCKTSHYANKGILTQFNTCSLAEQHNSLIEQKKLKLKGSSGTKHQKGPQDVAQKGRDSCYTFTHPSGWAGVAAGLITG